MAAEQFRSIGKARENNMYIRMFFREGVEIVDTDRNIVLMTFEMFSCDPDFIYTTFGTFKRSDGKWICKESIKISNIGKVNKAIDKRMFHVKH